MVRRLWRWLTGAAADAAPAQVADAALLSKLYIVHVDFPLSDPVVKAALEGALDRLREKYGVDFFVLEPGIKLSRFDAI